MIRKRFKMHGRDVTKFAITKKPCKAMNAYVLKISEGSANLPIILLVISADIEAFIGQIGLSRLAASNKLRQIELFK